MRDDVEFNIEFCEEVGKNPCLFDYNRADYCNRNAQDQAWQKIAQKFDAQAAECKERWKNVRGRYTKYKKQLKQPSGSRARRPKQYYLASHLQFLDSFLKSRPTKGNIVAGGQPTEKEAGDSDDGIQNEGADETQVSTQVTNQLTSNSPPSTPLPPPIPEKNNGGGYRKRGRSSVATLQYVNTSAYTYFQAKQQLLEQKQQGNSSNQPDPDMAFWQSILPDMKAMDDRQKRSFKMEILRLADQILHPVDVPSTGSSANGHHGTSSVSAPSRSSTMSTFDYASPSPDHSAIRGEQMPNIHHQIQHDSNEHPFPMDNYLTFHLKQLKQPSGSRARRPKQYYLASHLQFLDSFLKSRPSKGNIVAGGQPTEEEAGDSDDGIQNEGVYEEADETQVSTQVTNQLTSNSPPSTPLPPPIPEQNNGGGYRKRGRSSVATLQDVNTSA